jgi:hypothetical protein
MKKESKILLSIFLLVLLCGCKYEVTAPTTASLVSGRYQDINNNMILMLEEQNGYVEADLSLPSAMVHLTGTYDSINQQVFMSSGLYTIGFDLLYGNGGVLVGLCKNNGSVVTVHFTFVGKLEKKIIHDQGGIGGSY